MWARRMLIGSGLALSLMCAVPATAGAAAPSCGSTSGTSCNVKPTTPPKIAGHSTVPPSALPATGTISTTSPTPPAAAPTTTSLPFTGADIEKMAVVGFGAVLVGGIMVRRRRRPISA